jgi:arylsulfatase A-like enzyme
MRKRKLFFWLIPILTGVIFLVWPLGDRRYDISIDKDGEIVKQKNLESEAIHEDTVRPNIIFIVVDDLGLADLSLYKGGYPNTPHIDALGSEGVVFENAYVTAPMCSPSRAAMLTGRYQQRFGFEHQIRERYLSNRLEYVAFRYFIDSYPWIPVWTPNVPTKKAMDNQGIPTSEILLPELLKASGYNTALIGKWNLGENKKPCDFGFDYQFGFYSSHSLYTEKNTPGIHDQPIDGDFTDKYIWKDGRENGHAIFRNCEEVNESGYLTDVFTEEAVKYISEFQNDPFFLYLAYSAPHTPLQAPLEYMQKFASEPDPVKRTYYAMIANLDNNIGKLMNHLDNLGLDEKTLIFFISDNGGAAYTLTTQNGSYLGGKMTNFEGGLRVPFIFSWKNRIKPMRYEPMVSSMDIFQTITQIVGVELPTDRTYDGVNLWPYITGENASNPHHYLFWQIGYNKAIRSEEWKLRINSDDADTVLYNLCNDPFESTDLYRSQPDLAKQLAGIHSSWSAELAPPLWPPMIEYHFENRGKDYYFIH